ncbi:MAG TPA: cytochrome C biogenesis protein [Gemmatimonadetes bacterium]|uniref:Cytochrome C biogenesis protein transmembrane domain-containing protein n=1 Tax=marine metagenome TaxID=408172 RepID=A0A381R4K0_9ZZZZ|nr:cytochrome C biogenesis protein [Gemmatimonadota bacterium]|tara:strand:+ start:2147 stop:2875 length:729 start_codon:yes stop_codon:yes gene_type:complete
MNESVGLWVALTGGVVSFLSPCVLPLVPSYLSFVTGMSLEDLQGGVDRRATFMHSLLFVLGFSIIFIALGASASFLGSFLRYYEVWIARVGGAVIIVLGLHLTGVFKIVPLLRERRVHVNDKPAGYLGTIGVGAAFGAGWTPCIGPVLGAILTLASTQDTVWAGVSLLSVYSLGLAIPFLISALALDLFLSAFSRFRRFLPAIEKGAGVMLIILGLLLVTGTFTLLNTYLLPLTPDWILERI